MYGVVNRMEKVDKEDLITWELGLNLKEVSMYQGTQVDKEDLIPWDTRESKGHGSKMKKEPCR